MTRLRTLRHSPTQTRNILAYLCVFFAVSTVFQTADASTSIHDDYEGVALYEGRTDTIRAVFTTWNVTNTPLEPYKPVKHMNKVEDGFSSYFGGWSSSSDGSSDSSTQTSNSSPHSPSSSPHSPSSSSSSSSSSSYSLSSEGTAWTVIAVVGIFTFCVVVIVTLVSILFWACQRGMTEDRAYLNMYNSPSEV